MSTLQCRSYTSDCSYMCTKLPYRQGTPLGRHQQHDGTSHILLGGQRTDQVLKLQAVIMKLLKENQAGGNPLYHTAEVKSLLMISSPLLILPAFPNCRFFFKFQEAKGKKEEA